MAANTLPIFTRSPQVSWGTPSTTANTAVDGTGTVTTVFTADTEGSYIEKLTLKSLGTNVASMLNIFINNGSTNGTAANNTLIKQIPLPLQSASNVSPMAEIQVNLKMALPAGYKINVALATSVAAGWQVTAEGGKY